MTNTPLKDVVSSQYARWMYPEPIVDLPAWLANNWQWFDPSHAHRLLWPDQDYRAGLDILIAGCGTNQAAVIAFTNPGAKVVAIDVSQHSLDHQRFLKDKYGLKNLELHLLPIEEVQSLGRDFDLIISTGVLHHMASPQAGMNALAPCLRQNGVIAIMLYARYGRIGVDIMQSVFRDMELTQDEASVAKVKEVLSLLGPEHPIRSYMALAPDLGYDAGLVDTFLHGRERNYTIPECIELVTTAGLVFQDMFFKAPYLPWPFANNTLNASLSHMDREQQWSIMERLNFRNGCHFFTACRSDRPLNTYQIDFSNSKATAYVPSFRYRCALQGDQLSRLDWRMNLEANPLVLVQLIDGKRSIQDIAKLAAQTPPWSGQTEQAIALSAVAFFKALWQIDVLAMGLSS